MKETALKIFILILVPCLLYIATLPIMPLMEPDEARYAAIPDAMNATSDYVTPKLKELIYLEKPPLCYWVTAMSFKLFGRNEFAARLFAGLCAWGCILLVYRMGLYFHDSRTGLYSAAVLSTFLFHATIGRMNILDIPLCFFVGMATWFGFCYLNDQAKRKVQLYLLHLCSALAFLIKGLIGILFPFGIITIYLIISRRWRDIFILFSPVGIILMGAVVMPWLILIQQVHPDFFHFFIVREHFLRYTTQIHKHYEPFYFYLPIILAGTLPWCSLLPEVLKGLGKKWTEAFADNEKRFLLVWSFVIIIFYSFSSSKLVPYIAPAFLPIALFFGRLFRRYEDGKAAPGNGIGFHRGCSMPVIIQSFLFIAILFFPLLPLSHHVDGANWLPLIIVPLVVQIMILFIPFMIRKRFLQSWFLPTYFLFAVFVGSVLFALGRYMAPYKSAWPLSQAIINDIPSGQNLYQYKMCLYGIDFYTRFRTPVVDSRGELAYGMNQLPTNVRENYFPSSAAFSRILKDRKMVYCVVKTGKDLDRLKQSVPSVRVLWTDNEFYLLKVSEYPEMSLMDLKD